MTSTRAGVGARMDGLLAVARCRSIEALQGECLDYLRSQLQGPAAGVPAAGFYLFGSEASAPMCRAAGVEDGFLHEYEDEVRCADPVLQRLVAERRCLTGRGVLGTDWPASRAGAHLRRWGYGHNIQGPLVVEGRVVGTLNVAAARGAGAFRPQQVQRLDWLCAAASAALAGIVERDALRDALAQWRAALDVLPVPVVVSDAKGRATLLNRPALARVARDGALPGALSAYLEAAACAGERPATALPVDAPTLTVPLGDLDDHFLSAWLPQASGTASLAEPLPPRAAAVARLLCDGASNKAIARALGISEHTAKEHVAHLCRRLAARNRTELVSKLLAG
ncbi:hypothetical protein GRF61_07995 [Azoarcus sp. TTM-91]|uniref:helix-turn-helix transcriptional regulator n=1 Tax=Azoarcus sp. TTM-91 TaxID=2691581 RepID=UPI00145D4A6F|nr:LuxR C-terminal-related transcriptional regulator [Azoarcus sp. TTM-91]NMG34387.1 hypothetical protein [Azoarcus sp. TTM-91]